ncbi:MAG: hypothetical protein DWH91_05510 [Planctomycetota bacterium]|nr:MAG: hypothetical protein DWH91_05510 [Planctomycetota bacterium]
MGRSIAAVLGAYFVMMLTNITVLTSVYVGMGADRAFQAGTFEVTPLWLAVMFLTDIVAGILGGLVCLRIAPNSRAFGFLIGIVIVLGMLVAIPHFLPPRAGNPTQRDAPVGAMQASEYARQPGWLALLHPILGVAGLIGIRSLKSRNVTQN